MKGGREVSESEWEWGQEWEWKQEWGRRRRGQADKQERDGEKTKDTATV